MSGFEVLSADDQEQRARWLARWNRWDGREVLAHPAYVSLFAGPDERAICASFEREDGGGILLPLVLRPLSAEAWASTGETARDVTTPYGYGGPFAWGLEPGDADRFWDAMESWAAEQGVVTLFARLSLFPEQLAPFRGPTSQLFPNVVRSLDMGPDETWREYAHKVRKNVNKARRSGVEIEQDATGSRLSDFIDVYYDTMRRRQADDAYYFPREFFERMVRELPGQFRFFHALQSGRVVSTELVLVSQSNVYSFLGGTIEEAFAARPNDLLKHAIIDWGRNAKKRFFVLGGSGRADGIFRYKLAFAPNGEVPFQVGKLVFDETVCRRLVDARRHWEASKGRSWEPSADFFPAYRG